MTAKKDTRYMEEDGFSVRMQKIRDGEIELRPKDDDEIDSGALGFAMKTLLGALSIFELSNRIEFDQGYAYYDSLLGEVTLDVGVSVMSLVNPYLRQVGGGPDRRHSFCITCASRTVWLSTSAHPAHNDFVMVTDHEQETVLNFNLNGYYESLRAPMKAASRFSDTDRLYAKVSRVLSLFVQGKLITACDERPLMQYATISDYLSFMLDSEFPGYEQVSDDFAPPGGGVRFFFDHVAWPEAIVIDVQ